MTTCRKAKPENGRDTRRGDIALRLFERKEEGKCHES